MPPSKDFIEPRYMEAVRRFGVAAQEHHAYREHTLEPRRVDLLLLSFIIEGEARHWITGAEFNAGPGSVGITRYGESHMLLTGRRKIHVYNIFLDPRRHPLPIATGDLRRIQLLLFPQGDGFRHQLNRSVHFQLADPAAFLEIVRRIDQEIAGDPPGAGEVVSALLKVLVISCCRAALASGIHPAERKENRMPAWIPEICRHMDRHYDQPMQLDDLCRHAGRTRSYLCRSFKRHVGIPPGEYLLQRRLEAAMLALRGNREKILSVALDCGFNDISHFNRLFKARLGVTPSAYRSGRTVPE